MFIITFFVRCLGVSYYLFDAYANVFSPTIVIASICIFAAFKKINIKRDLSWLSGKTYYIYIFHTMIYRIVYEFIGDVQGNLELIMIPIIAVITFIISLGVSVIYDKYWKSKKLMQKNWYFMEIWKIIE